MFLITFLGFGLKVDTASLETFSDSGLPWLSVAERQTEPNDVTPGEYVLRTLFFELTVLAERKLELVLAELLVSPNKAEKVLIVQL